MQKREISLRDCLHFLNIIRCEMSACRQRRSKERKKKSKEMIFVHFLRRVFFILFCVIYRNGFLRLYMSTLTYYNSLVFLCTSFLCIVCFSFSTLKSRWKYLYECIHLHTASLVQHKFFLFLKRFLFFS